MTYERGAVVWSDDPFKDDPESGRPWLVLSNEAQPFREKQYMSVALSTSGHEEAIPLEGRWVDGGVPNRSYALPWAVHSAQQQHIEEYIGRLSEPAVERIIDELTAYLRTSS
ncbi:MAG: mRNA-degrading endonuclease toxin of MazEF toxin-antitoxin module [Natronomonas sp.]|jgi:mRNA-degrading endonuclease toxin of MazEF toxin-antitoxin module